MRSPGKQTPFPPSFCLPEAKAMLQLESFSQLTCTIRHHHVDVSQDSDAPCLVGTSRRTLAIIHY